ncbi:MAG: beta-lactamase family protein [Fibrobacteria bacterium]|nr:beta-lactamase family protein [Fibrobacteria bacterium]
MTKRPALSGALLTASLALSSCGSNAAIRTERSGDLRTDLIRLVDAYLAAEEVPGMGLLYASPANGVVQVARGVADVGTGAPITANTRYDIGSTTKTFVACLVLHLVDEGTLSLDAPIGTWLPDVPGGDSIRVSQLLDHTSGIGEYIGSSELFDRLYAWETVSMDDLARAGLRNPRHESRGTWSYSNTNYVLLAKIIETVTGHTLGAELESNIFRPLEMAHTVYMPEARLAEVPDLATGYDEGSSTTDDRHYALYSAAGGIVSTTGDMLKFARHLMSSPKLRERFLPAPVACRIEDGLRTEYGYGMIASDQYEGIPLVGHGGVSFGFKSEWWMSPDGERVLVYFANSMLRRRNYHEFRARLLEIIGGP